MYLLLQMLIFQPAMLAFLMCTTNQLKNHQHQHPINSKIPWICQFSCPCSIAPLKINIEQNHVWFISDHFPKSFHGWLVGEPAVHLPGCFLPFFSPRLQQLRRAVDCYVPDAVLVAPGGDEESCPVCLEVMTATEKNKESLGSWSGRAPWRLTWNLQITSNHPFRKENDLPNLHDDSGV